MQGKVTISHVFCLGMVNDAYLDKLIKLLLDNQITIMSLASGVSDFPPLKNLAEAGVSAFAREQTACVILGVSTIRLICLTGCVYWVIEAACVKMKNVEWLLDIALHGGATVMKDTKYGLSIGKRADFVVVAGDTLTEAVITQPPRTSVIKNGIHCCQRWRILRRNQRLILHRTCQY